MASSAAWPGMVAKVVAWVDRGAGLPRRSKVDSEQNKVAQTLEALRKAADQLQQLAPDLYQRLEEASADWRLAPDEAKAKAKALELVQWCHRHNKGKLVTCKPRRACTDADGNEGHYAFLKRQRMASRGVKHRKPHPAATAVLDEAFPGWAKDEQPGDSALEEEEGEAVRRPPQAWGQGMAGGKQAADAESVPMDDGHDDVMEVEDESQRAAALGLLAVGGASSAAGQSGALRQECHERAAWPWPGPATTGFADLVALAPRPRLEAGWLGRCGGHASGQAEPVAATARTGLASALTAEQFAVRLAPAACTFVLPGLRWDEEVGIEKQGFVAGGIFHVGLSVDWAKAMSELPPRQLARQAKVLARYAGHTAWRRWVFQGAFALLCLRCPAEAMTPERQAAVTREIEGSLQLRRQVRGALVDGRLTPWPMEFPVVVGADLEDLDAGLALLARTLRQLTGVQEDEAPSATTCIVPVRRASASEQQPYRIVGAGPDFIGPFGLAALPGQQVGLTINFIPGLSSGRFPGGIRVDGNVDDALQQAAQVAYSFIRAHGEWLEASYGFKRFDPRKPAQLRLNLEALSVLHRGASCGTAIAVRLVAFLTHRKVPFFTYLTGEASISGKVMRVCSYEEKLHAAALGPESARQTGVGLGGQALSGATPHVIVPAASVDAASGSLLEESHKSLRSASGTFHHLPTATQVRLPRALASRLRVLAAETLFDCLELCLPSDRPALPRPALTSRNLAVTYALESFNREGAGHVQQVEALLYPGSGGTLITASGDAKAKNVAELGLSFLREYWPHIKSRFGDEEQPRDPADGAWDLHVNLPEAGASQLADEPSLVWVVPAVCAGQACASCSLAVCGALLSLYLRRQLPSDVGFLAQVSVRGDVTNGSLLTAGLCRTMRQAGIRRVVTAKERERATQALLSSLPAAEVAGLSFHYMSWAIELVDFLKTQPRLE